MEGETQIKILTLTLTLTSAVMMEWLKLKPVSPAAVGPQIPIILALIHHGVNWNKR